MNSYIEDDLLQNTYNTLIDLQSEIDYKIDNVDEEFEEADLERFQILYNSIEDVINLVKDMLPPDNSDSWKIPKDKIDPYWQQYLD